MLVDRLLLLNAVKKCLVATTKDPSVLGSHCIAFTGTTVGSFNEIVGVSIPFVTDFTIVVEALKLYKTLSAYKTTEVTMTVNDNILTLKSGKSKHTLRNQEVSVVNRLNHAIALCSDVEATNLPKDFTTKLKTAIITNLEKSLLGIYVKGSDIVATNDKITVHTIFEGNLNPFRISNNSAKLLDMFELVCVKIVEAWCNFVDVEGANILIRTMNKEGYPFDELMQGVDSFRNGDILSEYKYTNELMEVLKLNATYSDTLDPICTISTMDSGVEVSTNSTDGSASEVIDSEAIEEVVAGYYDCVPKDVISILKSNPRTFGIRRGIQDMEAFVTWDDETIQILELLGGTE